LAWFVNYSPVKLCAIIGDSWIKLLLLPESKIGFSTSNVSFLLIKEKEVKTLPL
jgi:hypothetical protein